MVAFQQPGIWGHPMENGCPRIDTWARGLDFCCCCCFNQWEMQLCGLSPLRSWDCYRSKANDPNILLLIHGKIIGITKSEALRGWEVPARDLCVLHLYLFIFGLTGSSLLCGLSRVVARGSCSLAVALTAVDFFNLLENSLPPPSSDSQHPSAYPLFFNINLWPDLARFFSKCFVLPTPRQKLSANCILFSFSEKQLTKVVLQDVVLFLAKLDQGKGISRNKRRKECLVSHGW